MQRRWIIIVLALVAATAFAISVQTGRWWSVGDVEIGPFGSKHCFDGDCRPAGLTWVGGTERWARTGMGAWAGGLLSALVLAIMAAAIASRRVPKLAAKTALVAIGTTLATGALFIAQYPGVPGASVDRGLVIFAIAIVLGAVAAIAVLRSKPRVTDPGPAV
ncbi:MAG: hypothetical protein AB7T06_29170 [Kofleriaceae bacterium]